MDDDNSKSLNKYEFGKAINDYMLGFTAAESATLFSYFDVCCSCVVYIESDPRAFHPSISGQRQMCLRDSC